MIGIYLSIILIALLFGSVMTYVLVRTMSDEDFETISHILKRR